MKISVLFFIIGFLTILWSRIGYISDSGTRVFVIAICKALAALFGTALILLGALLLI